QVVVGRKGGGLKDEDILAAHVLLDLDEDFLVREAAHAGLAERDVEIAGYGLGQNPIGVARKKLHERSPAKDMSGLLTASARIASAKGRETPCFRRLDERRTYPWRPESQVARRSMVSSAIDSIVAGRTSSQPSAPEE